MDILLIFIRNPVPGKVKTRLAHTVGDAEALRIYGLLLEKTRSASLGVSVERWLCYSDFADLQDDWPNGEFHKKTQHSGGLGERMQVAFEAAFDTGANKVVIIGSDCPGLTGERLQQAFQALDDNDFVLGPTPDGGYYLLGMKQLESSVFHDIAWSTDTVQANTLRKIQAAGLKYALLPELMDVDTEQDWQEVQSQIQ